MTSPLLSVEDLHVGYRLGARTLPAVRGVDIEIGRGEIVGILGESGCGKSTLALAIPRLLPPNGSVTSGQMLFEGSNLNTLSEREMRAIRGAGVAMIFQDPQTSLNPAFTVGSQMTAALRAHSEERTRGLRGTVTQMLTAVGIPDATTRLHDHPHQFSGGMNQRIMIGTAMALRPSLLIADEPTSALDVTLQAEIIGLLRQLRDTSGTSVVIISHDPSVLARACDRLLVMYAGQVVEESSTESILRAPKHPYTRALLGALPDVNRRTDSLPVIPGHVPALRTWSKGCSFADRCLLEQPACRAETPPLVEDGPSWVRCILFGDHAVLPPESIEERREEPLGFARSVRQVSAASQIVSVRALRCHFTPRRSVRGRRRGVVRAVDGVDLDIAAGEILGLVGESGSGKTTLGRAIVRLISATSGSVSFEGRDLASLDRGELQRLRRRMQLIAQDAYGSLSPRRRVEQALRSPYEIHPTPADKRPSPAALLEMVELRPDLAGKLPHELSGGQARRVGIARALALDPAFVVADEPTAGLDASAAASILNLLRSLRDRLGLAFLVITHDLNMVAYLADRVAVMYLGKIVEVGPVDEILERPAHPYTKALLAAHASTGATGSDQARAPLAGEIPSPITPPPGCRFHTRCPYSADRCDTVEPDHEEVGDGHVVACHHWKTIAAGART